MKRKRINVGVQRVGRNAVAWTLRKCPAQACCSPDSMSFGVLTALIVHLARLFKTITFLAKVVIIQRIDVAESLKNKSTSICSYISVIMHPADTTTDVNIIVVRGAFAGSNRTPSRRRHPFCVGGDVSVAAAVCGGCFPPRPPPAVPTRSAGGGCS